MVNKENDFTNTWLDHLLSMENVYGNHRIKKNVALNRPTHVGMAILDLSKWLMYDFHNNYILSKFDETTLLFTDTDSL